MSAPPDMSGAGQEKSPQGLDHYPPPPGPPPTGGVGAPHHSYDPAHPAFAPPQRAESDIYNAPDEDVPPAKPPRPAQHNPLQGAAVPTQHQATKAGWAERLSALGTKAAAPFNALAHKVGSESFLPTSMDKECEKAARVLRAFCKDGVYTETGAAQPLEKPVADEKASAGTTPTHPAAATAASATASGKGSKPHKNRTLLHIPSKVISRSEGLAIFTTARVGYGVTGATGSGVLIARLPDGSWSPPSGIQVHTVGAGFVIGVDIYDCVVVINTREALEAFTRTRLSLGSDLAVVAGPWGAGGSIDFAAPERPPSAKGGKKGKGKAPYATPLDAPGAAAPVQATTGPETLKPDPKQQQQQPTTFDAPPNRQPSPLKQAMSNPVFSYVKSRGFYAGVQVDGTVVTERKDANAAFYGVKAITVGQILKGEVPRTASATWERHAKSLFDVIRGAEGYHHGEQNAPLDPPTTLMSNMHFGNAPASTTGAPAQAWVDPTSRPAPTKAHEAGYADSGSSSFPPPPPPGPPAAAMTKEQEAAAEAAAAPQHEPPGGAPPTYAAFDPALAASSTSAAPPAQPQYQPYRRPGESEELLPEDLPPAYVDDGQVRPGVGDSKTGHQ